MKNIKEITIYDIAQKLHFSPATVSRELNNHISLTRQGRFLGNEVFEAFLLD